jgi:hypothetical protein
LTRGGSTRAASGGISRPKAFPQPLFGNALFVDSALSLPAGVSLDSFSSGQSLANSCTRNGFVGTNDPADLTFNATGGNGTAQQGCTDAVWYNATNVWQYPIDGCVAYHDTGTPEVWPPAYGSADHCPPVPYTRTADPKFPIPKLLPTGLGAAVTQQSSAGNASQVWPNVPCDATHPIPGGARYYVTQATLLPGCRVNSDQRARDHLRPRRGEHRNPERGSSLNRNPGINAPDTSNPLLCPNYSGNDFHGGPLSAYCPGWSSYLQIYMTDSDTSSINFGNSVSSGESSWARTRTLQRRRRSRCGARYASPAWWAGADDAALRRGARKTEYRHLPSEGLARGAAVTAHRVRLDTVDRRNIGE